MIRMLFLFMIFFASSLAAINLPLDGEKERVAYVNMHKIFEEYPETEKARADLTKVIAMKKGDVTKKKEAIAHLKGEIEALKVNLTLIQSTSTVSPVTVSTQIVQIETSTSSQKVILEALLKEKESALSKAEAELPLFLTVSEEEIHKMEEGKTMALLANIYKAVESLSKEGGYSIILDKENILYGTDVVDLTPKVLRALKKKQ